MSRFGPLPLDIPVVLSREDARRLAEQELQKAKYGGLPSWVQSVLNRVNDLVQWLIDLYNRVGGGGGRNTPVVIVVAILLVAAIAVIIWRVGLPRLRHRATVDEAVAVDSARSPRSYREQADALAAQGHYRDAIGDRFRAVVRELEELTLLDVRPARTAGEVAAVAGQHLPDQRESLADLATVFNAAWYGDRPPDEHSYQRICVLDEAISDAARRVDLGVASL